MKHIFRTLALVVIALMAMSTLQSCNYNSLVEKEQNVDQAWAQVENQYQRRADLIPNLVNTVKGYSEHESETFIKVTQARSGLTEAYNAAELWKILSRTSSNIRKPRASSKVLSTSMLMPSKKLILT